MTALLKETEARLVLDAQAILGEGPIWDNLAQVLWWIDILACKVHKYSPADDRHESFEVGQRIGTVVPRARGGLMLAVESGFAAFDPATGKLEPIADPEPDRPENRFNDGKCDPAGRFWAGTMEIVEENMSAGSLYCLHEDHRVTRHVTDLGVSNGLVWTRDQSTMYFIDSPTRRVDAFDYDVSTGAISNRRPAIELPEGMGFPDGMTIDCEDRLWVALWNGWGIACFDPRSGKLLGKIDVAAEQVTACALGGPEMNQLYITSARRDIVGQRLEKQPLAGGLFVAEVGTHGVEANRFAG